MRRRDPDRKRLALLRDEVGTIYKEGALRCVLVYPSPYPVAMSSLGFQTVYRILNEQPGVACERAVLESLSDKSRLRTIESGRLAGDATVLGLSVATEEEVASAARALIVSGIPPLESERRGRRHRYPLIIAGGPLTYADGSPLCAIADVVLGGEAEDTLTEVIDLIQQLPSESHDTLLERIAEVQGAVVPAFPGVELPTDVAVASSRWLPSFSAVVTPRSEFGSMFLVEAARGCPRRCTFCVMGGRKFRPVTPDDVFNCVPEGALRVGLVGTALTDHPQIKEIMRRLLESGRRVSLSSLRADRLDEELLSLLVRSEIRTLTIAADGSSERLRRAVRKQVTASDLLQAAKLGAEAGLRAIKLYAMVGLPTETEDDIAELAKLALEMSRILPVSLAVSPFVPKAGTPLAGAPFAPRPLIRRHLAYLRAQVRSQVELRASSVRGAWIENAVARGGFRAGLAAVDVARERPSFAAWKDAIERHGLLD